jgi:energy-coupling factor transporter ATP-binding protein EcfA2
MIEQQTMPLGTESTGTPALKLLRLSLHNFKGVRQFTLELPGGQDVSVLGDNATGKTTLFDAFTWLLFDKDSANRKDFQIKTLNANGQVAHGLEHEVEAVFSLGERKTSLRKVYAEKWTKQRGMAEKQFTGHETSYYVDGVPVKKQEYEAKIARIVDEKVFRLLSDPAYFNEVLHWEERRRILLEICGDVSDSDVIAANSKLSELTKVLGEHTLDDHHKIIKARRGDINKELEKIPVRIAEAQRALPDVSAVKPDVLKDDIAKARAARQNKQEQIARAEAGGAIAEKQSEVVKIQSRMLDLESAARRQADEALGKKRIQLRDAQSTASGLEWDVRQSNQEATRYAEDASRLAGQIEDVRNQWYAVDGQEFTYSAETVCPTCGQSLPEDTVEAARDKALSEFNLSKSKRLESITADGLALRIRKERAEAQAQTAREKGEASQKRLDDVRRDIAGLETALDEALAQQVDVTKTPDYADLVSQKDALTKEIADLKAGSQSTVAALRNEVATLEQAIQSLEYSRLKLDQRNIGEQRIAELQTQEKVLAGEYERLEREMYLTEEFIRCKVRMLEERINSRFRYATFKLFEQQVNGALSECCETLYNGVPYNSNLNRGARINVGLDIINALSQHYGFSAPIFVDNREAVTKLLATDAQVISLVVSEPDKTLRIVKEAS